MRAESGGLLQQSQCWKLPFPLLKPWSYQPSPLVSPSSALLPTYPLHSSATPSLHTARHLCHQLLQAVEDLLPTAPTWREVNLRGAALKTPTDLVSSGMRKRMHNLLLPDFSAVSKLYMQTQLKKEEMCQVAPKTSNPFLSELLISFMFNWEGQP